MRILIVAIGKMKEKALVQLYHTYQERIPWDIQVKEMEIKQPLPVIKRQEKEGELLLQAIPHGAKKIILDEKGLSLTSTAFAGYLEKWQCQGIATAAFLIGGADGHSQKVKEEADLVLSLGAMTWPHQLVRIMLGEQLYRAYTILQGHPYHRG